MNAVAVGEHDGSSRLSRPKVTGGERKGRENQRVENLETQTGTHVPELVERLARMDPAELERLLARVLDRHRWRGS